MDAVIGYRLCNFGDTEMSGYWLIISGKKRRFMQWIKGSNTIDLKERNN